MSAIGLRVRDQEGRSQQPDRPRGRRGAAARSCGASVGHRRLPGRWCCCSRPGSTSSWCSHGYADASGCSASGRREEEVNRHLRLEIETLRSPRRIEEMATEELHLVAPARDQAIVIERVTPPAPPDKSIVAGALSRIGSAAGGPVADQQAGSGFRLPWQGRERVAASRRRAARRFDWRDDACARGWSSARCCSALWTVGSRPGWSICRSSQHADLMARAERQQQRTIDCAGQARRDRRSQRPRARLQRRRRHDLRRSRRRSRTRTRSAQRCAAALDDCDAARAAGDGAERCAATRSSPTCARKVSPDEAQRVAALELKGVGFLKESRRYYPNKELAAHVLGYVGLDNAGLGGLESPTTRRSAAREGKMLVQTDARRQRVISRVERPPTAGAALELTIDQYLQHIAERELRAGVEENSAAGGTARRSWIRTPARSSRWPTSRPSTRTPIDALATIARGATARSRISYEPGSTFKIVTASAALEEGVIDARRSDRLQPRLHHASAAAVDPRHRTTTACCRSPTSSSSRATSARSRSGCGSAPSGSAATSAGSASASRSRPDFRGENAGIVWNPAQLDPSALASVSMGYQVGVTPLQMAAAVSSVANGGALMEPRVVRAFIKDGRRVDGRRTRCSARPCRRRPPPS